MHMREASVEARLLRHVTARRGRALKLLRLRGWPDRLVLLPGGVVWFVECKRPQGGRFEPLQVRVGAWLSRKGFNYVVLRTPQEVDAWAAALPSPA
jgi:hypothetical protein